MDSRSPFETETIPSVVDDDPEETVIEPWRTRIPTPVPSRAGSSSRSGAARDDGSVIRRTKV